MPIRVGASILLIVVLAGCAASPRGTAAASATSSAPSASPAASTFVSSWQPTGLGFDDEGNLLVTDCIGGHVYQLDTSGHATIVAGTGVSTTSGGLSGEGVPALDADIHCPADAAGDGHGNVLVVDHANNRIRSIDPNGIIKTLIGSGPIGTGNDDGDLAGDGGPAAAATLQEPWGIFLDSHGNLFLADRDNHAVRRVDGQGVITTIAGTGNRGFSGDGGPALAADLSRPQSVVVDAQGNVYFSDSDNHEIRRVDSAGTITSFAGTGAIGYSGDGGPATAATMADPNGLVLDALGNLYFVDDELNMVRRVGRDGIITTVAGTGDVGFSGDGGPASAAQLSTPSDLIFDVGGNLYIADQGNHRIRMLPPDGTIVTFSTGAPA
jgi:sugar lactone lactonase YvrE